MLSRKELFSGCMVLFTGLFYAISLGSILFHYNGVSPLLDWINIKMALFTALYIMGGILYLLRKRWGWVLAASIILTFILFVFLILTQLSQTGGFGMGAMMYTGLFALFLMAFIFLFNKPTRVKYKVSNKSYLFSMLLYLFLICLNFWI